MVAKSYIENEKSNIYQEKQGNSYSTLKTDSAMFGMLVQDLSFFISSGRSQPFNLANYYTIKELKISKSAK